MVFHQGKIQSFPGLLRQTWSVPWLWVLLYLPWLCRCMLCSGYAGLLAVSQTCQALSYGKNLHELFPLPWIFLTQMCTLLSSSPLFFILLKGYHLRMLSWTILNIIATLLCIVHAIFFFIAFFIIVYMLVYVCLLLTSPL